MGAFRTPLISKHANKNFYKGTGSYPKLGFKRQGVHSRKHANPYLLVDSFRRHFVVPESLANTAMKPYVSKHAAITDADYADWPVASDRPSSNPRALFGTRGFDGKYLTQLVEFMHHRAQVGPDAALPENTIESFQKTGLDVEGTIRKLRESRNAKDSKE